MERDKKGLYLRAADEADMMLLYQWVNDPSVRKSAFQSDLITLEEHKRWFYRVLKEPDIRIYILMDGENPVGQIRLTRENGVQILDCSIDADKRGLGYGVKIFLLAEQVCFCGVPMLAKVKIENVQCQHVLEKCGYQCRREDKFYSFLKYVDNSQKEQ